MREVKSSNKSSTSDLCLRISEITTILVPNFLNNCLNKEKDKRDKRSLKEI